MTSTSKIVFTCGVVLLGCNRDEKAPKNEAVPSLVVEQGPVEVRDLELTVVVPRAPAWDAVLEYVRADEQAATFGIEVAEETWLGPGETTRRALYLRGPGRAALAGYLGELFVRKPELALTGDHDLRFGPMEHPSDEQRPAWRSYLVARSSALVISQLDLLEVDTEGPVDALRMTLVEEDTQALAELTTAHVGDKLAIVIGDRVDWAPVVLEPLTEGELSLSDPSRDLSSLKALRESLLVR